MIFSFFTGMLARAALRATRNLVYVAKECDHRWHGNLISLISCEDLLRNV